jgi:hypothetical protein
MYKESGVHIQSKTKMQADSGYQGLKSLHPNSELPYKRRKKQPLTQEEKIHNKKLAGERVIVENVIGRLKRFKIISDRYRNRRKRFMLRFSLIAGIHNFELKGRF